MALRGWPEGGEELTGEFQAVEGEAQSCILDREKSG